MVYLGNKGREIVFEEDGGRAVGEGWTENLKYLEQRTGLEARTACWREMGKRVWDLDLHCKKIPVQGEFGKWHPG